MEERVKHISKERVTHCLNCGEAISLKYCSACGQEGVVSVATLKTLLCELADHLFNFDSKLFLTLKTLLFQPGSLTVSYLEGRRISYLAPLRVYVTMSVLFFLLLSMQRASLQAGSKTNEGVTLKKVGNVQVGDDYSSQLFQIDGKDILKASSLKDVPDTLEELERQEKAKGKKLSWLDRKLLRQVVQLKRKGVESLSQKIVGNLPILMFFLLPLFTFAFKIVYFRSGKLFAEHLIFLLHTHAMLYMALSVVLLPWLNRFAPPISVACLIYIFLSLRKVYKQSWGVTFIKMSLLTISYIFIFAIGIVSTMIISFLQF